MLQCAHLPKKALLHHTWRLLLTVCRQSLGTVTLQQAQQLLDALAWLSRAPQGPDFSATGVTSALALLCRWAKQLTQPGQGSSSDTQLLQTAVDVVLQLVAGGTPLILTAHTQAAALLFLATAFPSKRPIKHNSGLQV